MRRGGGGSGGGESGAPSEYTDNGSGIKEHGKVQINFLDTHHLAMLPWGPSEVCNSLLEDKAGIHQRENLRELEIDEHASSNEEKKNKPTRQEGRVTPTNSLNSAAAGQI